jgi:DNA-binding protein H-NS
MAKAKKARAAKYEEKLKVEGITFDELINMSVNYTPPKKEKAPKPAKKAVKKASKKK